MSILPLLLPYLKKFKVIMAALFAALLTYLICMRWRNALGISSPWPWVGGAFLLTLIIFGFVVLVKKRREKRMAAALEAGIATSDDEKVDLRGEIKALRENWTRSLEKLKDSRLMADGGATLFRMPWYVIIGEPASGKSTLLRKSGLDFPVGDATVSGMHGTRNCDWWFANEAIFLDTAGRYIIETQDAEWVAFLGLLKKYRKKKPINGVLVAVAANSLLTKSHEDLLQDGKRIRARVDELIDLLGVNFPVYVLVTKCDLVSGFVEFFGPVDDRRREQMFGWTNPADPKARFDGETFDQCFDLLSDQVFRMRPWLETQAKRRDLMKAFLFPEEFQYLSQPLRDVMEVVFRPNVYQETPVCRGIYFSSGTQVGSPLAMALDDMAKDLNIPAEFGFGLGMEEEKEIRTYFIKDLVGEQILKDKEMTWRTWQDEVRVKKRRTGWGIIGLSAAALLLLFSLNAFFTNQGRLGEFKVGIEGKRPLDVAKDCIETRRKAGSASIFDLGLNQNDELRPTIDRAFRDLFSRGCLESMIAAAKKPLQAGIGTGDDGNRDVRSYVAGYEHYLYLKRGLAGELPEEEAPEEEAHYRYFYDALREDDATGGAKAPDLRMVLREYGEVAGFDDFPEHRREEIEGSYEKEIRSFVGSVKAWIAKNQTARGELRGNLDDAIKGLKETCLRRRAEVVPHETPESLVEIARELRRVANPSGGGGAGTTPIDRLASGIAGPEDLRNLLLLVKKSVDAEGDIASDIDGILSALGKSRTDDTVKSKESARQGLIGYLDRIIEVGESGASYDRSPTEATLRGRREEITAELVSTESEAWKEIRPRVAAIEEGDLTVTDENGVTTRKEGWWDTLLLLRTARVADSRKAEYLSKGLAPWLAGERWKKERTADRDYEVYTRARLDELILPRLRKQTGFYEDELLARTIREETTDVVAKGLRVFFAEMESYWLGAFRRSLPSAAAATVTEAYDQLRLWTDGRGELLRTCADIRAALYDITRLEGPEDEPILAATLDDRRRVFTAFVLCFDPEEKEVRRHLTIAGASKDFGDLMRALEPVAGGGFGGGDRSRARILAGKVMAGGGRTSPFARAMQAVREFKKEGAASRPAGLVAEWMEKLVRNAWDGVVGLTAEDINMEWERRRAGWARALSGGSPAGFMRVFGERGEFLSFRGDYLEPFFEIPGFRSRPTEGATLRVLADFANFMSRVSSLGGEIFDDRGDIRSERIRLELGLGGSATPVSLLVEYRTSSGTTTSKEFRNDIPVSFEFDWTPTTCLGVRFLVGLGGGRQAEFKWEGKWAVADAFFKATRVGSEYIWKGDDPAAGAYEVHLTVTGATRLLELYRSGGGKPPFEGLAASMPTRAVEVRK